jgi:hypothetical protein
VRGALDAAALVAVPAVHVVVVVIVHVRMRRFREHETFVDVHLGSILQNSIYVCMYVCM